MTLSELRQAYVAAVQAPAHAEALEQRIEADGPADHPAVAQGYLASTQALRARHVQNPLQKLNHLQRAQRTFEQAVRAAPDNPEIRLLRFAVQRATPPFLNMSGDMADDVRVVIDHREALDMAGVPPAAARELLNFVAESEFCTEAEGRALLDTTT
ncbi:MAG: hypothetical protein WBA12_08515 [Catalinimonas sp.]